MAALGGHGFFVSCPPGHKEIEKTEVDFYTPLVHESAEGELIRKSGFLSAMRRKGGINFTVGRRGGYRPNACSIAVIDAQQMANAIDDGCVFFYNTFSGLVFGAGKKDREGCLDGIIPKDYFSLFDL